MKEKSKRSLALVLIIMVCTTTILGNKSISRAAMESETETVQETETQIMSEAEEETIYETAAETETEPAQAEGSRATAMPRTAYDPGGSPLNTYPDKDIQWVDFMNSKPIPAEYELYVSYTDQSTYAPVF